MLRLPILSLLSVFLVLALINTSRAETGQTVWDALSDGGVVLFRHALAPGTGDPANFEVGNCATQRNLNDRGRADAKLIGKVFRERGIEVGRVLTSQWCRCWQTAELAFPGIWEEEPAFNSFFGNRSRGPAQTAEAADILRNWKGPGALVVITHQVNITALTNVFPSSGEGIVLTTGPEGLDLVGRLPVSALE